MSFTGTPPLDLDNVLAGSWGSDWKLYRRSGYSTTVVRYGLYQISTSSFAGSGASGYDTIFSINSSNQLEFDVATETFNPHTFKIGSQTASAQTSAVVSAGDTIYVYDSVDGSGSYAFKFDVPSELGVSGGSSGGGSGGTTQTYTRTPHTGTVLNTTQKRINRPDYDITQTTSVLNHTEDYYYRKIGNEKFRLRWHDQNESSTYTCTCYVETSTNVYDHYILSITQGSGDVQWDIDTSNGSGNTNILTGVKHNGHVYITFSEDVWHNGVYYTAGTLVKEWTYTAVGPFSALFRPKRAKLGDQIELGFQDLNTFPDTPFVGSWEAPDGTTGNINLVNGNPFYVMQYAQKGNYLIFDEDVQHRGTRPPIGWHKFITSGKVSGNFW